jgi:hypothetical protein
MEPKTPIVKLKTPPKVTRESLIGYTFGIRPYREGGIRLERENIKDKVIYHNYGHGGAGVSMAPGCTRIITDLFLMECGTKVKEVAIIGCGYMGLFQAIRLAEHGYVVNVYADNFPAKQGSYKGTPLTTSQVAGGWWMPFGIDISNRKLHNQISKDSWEWYQNAIAKGKYKGVAYKETYLLDYPDPIPAALPDNLLKTQKVKMEFGNGQQYDGQNISSMLICGDTFLNELWDEAKALGVNFNNRSFNDLDDVLNLRETVICNCSAWGSYKLFGDKSLIPISGHLLHINKVPGVDYFFNHKLKNGWVVSWYPHNNKLAIGLAYEKIGWITEPNEKTIETLIKNLNEFLEEKVGPKPKL